MAAMTYDYYGKSELVAIPEPAGTRVGDLKRMILKAETDYANADLALLTIQADPRITAADKVEKAKAPTANKAYFEAYKRLVLVPAIAATLQAPS